MQLAEPVIGRGQVFHLLEDLPDAETPAIGNKRPIAVIGAGFSGTIAALKLVRRLPKDQPVVLVERAIEFAQGIAYATGESDHLLNVRATNMSAFDEDPLHFDAWLKRRAPEPGEGYYETESGAFASRGLYGRYLRSILDMALRETASRAQLRLLPDDLVDAVPMSGGYELVFAGGQKMAVSGVVLANGNLLAEQGSDPCICDNPWGAKAAARLRGSLPVLIVGTGLTMIDLAISLRRRGFQGPIVAMSRGGLLPTRHAPTEVWPTPELTAAEEGSLTLLMRRLRAEVRAAAAQGVGWRAVIDSMRPITASVWSRLASAERARFLRHARRYWDVHRHRMAPPHADLIERMAAEGSLTVLAGRIRGMESDGERVQVRYVPRGEHTERTLSVQRVIKASGLESLTRTRDTLVQNLLDRGLVRLDRHGFGIDVTDDLSVLHADGTQSDHMWALGPIVRGVFWECVAVPDIRVQATNVAVSVAARLREDAPRWSFII